MERVLVQYPNQARTGPHTWDELRQMALTGQLPQDALLIDDRTGERRTARDVPELFAPAPALRASQPQAAVPPKSNKNMLIIIALVVALGLCVLCAAGGVAGMFFARERASSSSTAP